MRSDFLLLYPANLIWLKLPGFVSILVLKVLYYSKHNYFRDYELGPK